MQGAGPSSLKELAQEEVLAELYSAARNLNTPYCVGGSLGKLPLRLAVAGEGGEGEPGAAAQARVVELPRGGEQDVAALLAECAPAKMGKGTETVLDPSYRRGLALPGKRVFTQELEAAHLAGVLAAVGRLLMPAAGPLTARLHALNACRSGDFFKAHRDTPRGDPGFVGSLVVCLPTAHAGGTLRVEHGGRSVEFDWGPAATAGEVQWAAFFPDCSHEVKPVTGGTRITLAYELFARPDTASGPPAPLHALTDGTSQLARTLRQALNSSSFMMNGGRIGFPCQHSYPQSLARGLDEQKVRAMLKGADAAVLHTLAALGVPCTLVRVWEAEDAIEAADFRTKEEWDRADRALVVSPLLSARIAGDLTKEPGTRRRNRFTHEEDGGFYYLKQAAKAELNLSIDWLGDNSAFPEWTMGTLGDFFGNDGAQSEEFYCSLGIVAEVPPFAERPTIRPNELAWAPGGAGGVTVEEEVEGDKEREGQEGKSKVRNTRKRGRSS